MRPQHLIWILPVSGIALALACAGPTPTSGRATDAAARDASDAPQLLLCPSQITESSPAATIDVLGGALGFGGDSLVIPPNAVATPTAFQIVVPAARHLKVEIHAVGLSSFVFQQPVRITIDYSRCPASAVPAGASLEGVYIDSTNDVLQEMGGSVDTLNSRVTFSTGHLSGYAVAY